MLLKLIDHKIRNAFSSSAAQYEALSGLQREIGRELIKKVDTKEDVEWILDVGMGTGRMTNALTFYFPGSRIVGVDFAQGMVDMARQKYDSFYIAQTHAAGLPFKADSFDLVFSNLAFQWVEPMDVAFKEVFKSLKPEGKFYATIFGFDTLKELFVSLEQSPSALSLKRLPKKENIERFLTESGFKDVHLETEVITTHFKDLFALIRWLKHIGANTLSSGGFIGRSVLNQANQYYITNFNDRFGVSATFEVIWIKATKIT